MHQYRLAVGRPISSRLLMPRRGPMPTQAYAVRHSLPRFPWQARINPNFPGSMAIVRDGDHLEGFFDIVKSAGGAIVGAVKSVFKDSTVNLPGGVSVPARDLPRVVSGSTVTFGKGAPGPVEQLVEQVPGGMGTIATVAVVGLGVMLLMGRGRR